MSSQRSENSTMNINDENSMENETVEDIFKVDTEPAIILKKDPITEFLKENVKTVFIPKYLHQYFQCAVDTHVFINNPWKKISRKKIIENLQIQKTNSCFWEFRNLIEALTTDDVLIGYKSSSNTDEEFLLCTTDKAKQFVEEAQIQAQKELEQQVERSMYCKIGPWDSKGSEQDIEDMKTVSTHEKIKYKWIVPKRRIQAKAEFENTNSKSIRNQYVKLQPQSKEIFEISDMLIMESNIQAKIKTVNREMQTIPKLKDNKCIQSTIEKELIDQSQPKIKSTKVLDDFLLKNTPNIITQLQYNELYDIYRDDYKLMEQKSKTEINHVDDYIKIYPGYQNEISQKKYVSCHTWHPTIVGVFAVSYMANSNELLEPVSLKKTETTALNVELENTNFSISYNEDDDDQNDWNKQPNVKLLDNDYDEKLMFFLNEEFVQNMKILQIAEEEETIQEPTNDINKRLRNTSIYDSNEQLSAFNEFDGEGHSNEDDVISNHTDYSVSYEKMTSIKGSSDIDEVYHHDSDTESFYNIWGEDDEWLYNNKLRNVVRNLHRGFNKKYNREAKEEKLFELLMSETKKQQKNEETKKNIIKLTKDMFKAGDICKKSKLKKKNKIKLNNENFKLLQNDQESMIKRESTPLIDEQNNAVIIWSISDNVFPKLRLESPEEVRCVEFNPRNGNTVVGGLTNGQICIWDIEGKLEAMDSNLSMSEKEKQHKKHLYMHMKWSLDVNFKTRIRPTALSAIIESHETTVTAIQWIHPMNKITSLGKLISTEQGKFSDQFISASLDGTIKVWDLQPKSMQTYQKNSTNGRFGYPKSLLSNKSPLSIHNNQLKPSYSIIIREPAEDPMNSTTHSPITALSFEIPLMQYKYTSDQPLTIGKRQFEYIPVEPSDPNRTLVVGTIMGQIGVVTWEGYDTYPRDGNVEECKHIWWKQIHDGPINCIKRNYFLSDIHLVCGGKVVSVWSLKYKNGPIWWKRFHDFTNSVLWSTTHPTKFRVSFNNSGVIQFWNFMVHTHQPYYTADIFLKDGLIASLSSPPPPYNYISADSAMYTKGINDMVNYKKHRIICFSDSAGTVMIMTIRATLLKPNEIEEVASLFQKECDWLRELDAWNEKYKAEFGESGENDVDDHDYKSIQSSEQLHAVDSEHVQPILSQDQVKKAICDETFKWYINRRGPQTRLGKMKDEYLQREKQYMVEAMMKKKNVTQKQIDKYCYGVMNKSGSKSEEISIIRSEADKKYREIINKLLAADQSDEYKFDAGLKRNTELEDSNIISIQLQKLSMLNIEIEKEKFINHINNSHYRSEKINWTQVFDYVEKEDKNILNDPNIFKNTNFRSIRQKMLDEYKMKT